MFIKQVHINLITLYLFSWSMERSSALAATLLADNNPPASSISFQQVSDYEIQEEMINLPFTVVPETPIHCHLANQTLVCT